MAPDNTPNNAHHQAHQAPIPPRRAPSAGRTTRGSTRRMRAAAAQAYGPHQRILILARDTWRSAEWLWSTPWLARQRSRVVGWTHDARAGVAALVGGMISLTLLIALINRITGEPLPSPGLVYLPLVAMLAYHWGGRYALVAGMLELACVYYFFALPLRAFKPLSEHLIEQLATLAIVTGFVLALVWLARARSAEAEREAGRFAALNNVGTALARELDEHRLLDLIANTARDLADADFAAFTLRPLDDLGRPSVPAEGTLFHLASVIGVTTQEESLFRRMPLGGEGLLAPIFRHGVAVRVADALELAGEFHGAQFAGEPAPSGAQARDAARAAARAYAHGLATRESLRSMGVPPGHPIIRSFLGAPLLDRDGDVRGGLLLGHSQPGRFSEDDETLLVGLATQAAIALENARLYRAARAQAQELDAIFQSISDGITLVDRQGQILRENAAARRLYAGLTTQGGNEPSLAPIFRAPAEQALRGAAVDGVPVTLVGQSGEERDFLVSASPLRAASEREPATQHGHDTPPEVAGAVLVWHDVTEAHRLEEERRARAEVEARRALLQTVIDEMPSGVYLVRGADARLVLANRAAAAVWGAQWQPGMPMADFLATSGVRVQGTAGTPLASDELATVRSVRMGAAIRHHQEVIRQPGGTSLPVLFNAVALDPSLVSWPEGGAKDGAAPREECGALVVLQDVTALKEAERLKDEFIAIAAHELRNPMAAIKGYAQMLVKMTARGKGTELADWQYEAIETIDASTARLVELTDDLLDVTRLQAGRLELHTVPTDLVALARRVAKRLQITTPKHAIQVDASHEFIVTQLDAQRAEQVLGNLLNNAIKYSPDGGMVTVTVAERPEQGVAELTVADNGIGIPAAQRARIFGRFVRAENAKERGIGGTGLGLYLCRELVERHGGRIWFESEEGRGSSFHSTFPLAEVSRDEIGA